VRQNKNKNKNELTFLRPTNNIVSIPLEKYKRSRKKYPTNKQTNKRLIFDER